MKNSNTILMRLLRRLSTFAIGMALSLSSTAALAESAGDGSLHMKLAEATQLALADNRDDARNLLESIASEYPDSPEAYNNLAVLAAYSEDWNGAIELLKKALATSKSLQTSYQNLNLIYRYRAALAYRAALPDDSDQPLALPDLTMITAPAAAGVTAERTTEISSTAVTRVTESEAALDIETAGKEIDTAIRTWAHAWSNQDVDTYLASYAEDYSPDGRITNSTWRKTRRERVLSPASINVSLTETEIDVLSNDRALITFVQHYDSNVFSDAVKKLVIMERSGGTWAITREHVIQ